MLTLHETLLLFALHDDRGTVHSRAWVGLDDALRGAVVAEWMLRGALEVQRSGLASWTERRLDSPLLDEIRDSIATRIPTDTFELHTLFSALEQWMPGLRGRIERCLTIRGAVSLGEIDRHELADTKTLRNEGPEESHMLSVLRQIVRDGPRSSRRLGILAGLVHALDLWPVLVSPSERDAAREVGTWVIDHDAIVAHVHRAVLERSGVN